MIPDSVVNMSYTFQSCNNLRTVNIYSKHIDCKYENILGEDGEIPTPLLQAMLLMIGNLYQNRESVSFTNTSEIPFAYDYLLSLHSQIN